MTVGSEPETLSGGPEEPSLTVRSRVVAVVIGGLVVVAGGTAAIAVHYRHEIRRVDRSSNTGPPEFVVPVSTSQNPTVARATYRLLNGRLHIDVVGVTSRNTTIGTLILDGRLTGARPGVRYRLTGGDCTANSHNHRIWASGVADAHGVAFLRSRSWVLPATDRYYAELDRLKFRFPDPRTTGVAGALVQATALPLHPVDTPC
jgi:hypothetical protein